MPDEFESQGSANVRVTVRTFKAYVDKLRLVAMARDLRLGRRLSIGAAINYIISKYDTAEERELVDAKKRRKR